MTNTASSPCASAIEIASDHAAMTSHYCGTLWGLMPAGHAREALRFGKVAL